MDNGQGDSIGLSRPVCDLFYFFQQLVEQKRERNQRKSLVPGGEGQMKAHNVLNYTRHILIALCIIGTVCVLQGCSTPTDLLYSFVQSPRFKFICYDLIPENRAKESRVKAFIASGKAVIGNNDPYHDPVLYSDSLTSALSSQIGRNDGEERLYTFLLQNKYLTLRPYYLKMERRNVPGKVFLLLQRDFHHYQPSLDRFLARSGGKCILQLGQRKLEKITFRNGYKMNVGGMSVKVRAYKFSYRVQPSLPGLPGPGNLYEGSVKFILNPDDGQWRLEECSLPDKGAGEFLDRLTGPKWTDLTAAYARQAQWRRQQERERQLEAAKKYSFTIGPSAVPQIGEGPPKEIYLGVLTSDDAVKIEPVRGSYNFVHFDFVNPREAYDYYSHTDLRGGWPPYRVGQTVQFTGDGGAYQEYRTNGPVFFDLQRLTSTWNGGSTGPLDHVLADAGSVYIFGSPDARAKVTIYCVDNSDIVSTYGTSVPNEKSFMSCSKRFQNIGIRKAPGTQSKPQQFTAAGQSQSRQEVPAIQGEWTGFYDFPARYRLPAVPFDINILQDGRNIHGSISERVPFRADMYRSATFVGNIDSQGNVRFVKRYDAQGNAPAPSATYEGHLAADRNSIKGVWTIPGHSGSFVCRRKLMH